MAYNIYVIIPVYNAEGFIDQAVQSVLNQKSKRIRIVLIDDGSTDGSGKQCDALALAHSEIEVIHQRNGGVSAARNTGIEYVLNRCQGRDEDVYIAFLDADDFWNFQVRLDDFDPEEAELVFFSSVMSNSAGKRYGQALLQKDEIRFYEVPNRQWIPCGTFGSLLYRADLIRENHLRFLNGVRIGEDVIFWRQATFCARKIKFSSELLYIYRLNHLSAIHNIKTEDVLTLHVPCAWERAMEWMDGLPQYTPNEKSVWKQTCAAIVGARLLEYIRIMAERGVSAGRIYSIVIESGLKKYLDDLDIDCLAQWQKSDLILYRQGLRKLVVRRRIGGIIPELAKVLLKIPVFRSIREAMRFRVVRL